MSDIKVKKQAFYKSVNQKPIQDMELSWKARGILAYILSLPDDWKGQIWNLKTKSKKDGEKSLKSGLKELVEKGYAEIKCHPREDGKFMGKYYVFYDYKITESNYGI